MHGILCRTEHEQDERIMCTDCESLSGSTSHRSLFITLHVILNGDRYTVYDRVADSMESGKNPLISLYITPILYVIREYPLELLVLISQGFPAISSGVFPVARTSSVVAFQNCSSSS